MDHITTKLQAEGESFNMRKSQKYSPKKQMVKRGYGFVPRYVNRQIQPSIGQAKGHIWIQYINTYIHKTKKINTHKKK